MPAVQSHIQHYVEPAAPAGGSATSPLSTPALPSISSVYGTGPLLPLGQGTLTLNAAGVPILVVCTKADLMDKVGEDVGMKGAGWEERTDWIQQALRTICLSCKLSSAPHPHELADHSQMVPLCSTPPRPLLPRTLCLLNTSYIAYIPSRHR